MDRARLDKIKAGQHLLKKFQNRPPKTTVAPDTHRSTSPALTASTLEQAPQEDRSLPLPPSSHPPEDAPTATRHSPSEAWQVPANHTLFPDATQEDPNTSLFAPVEETSLPAAAELPADVSITPTHRPTIETEAASTFTKLRAMTSWVQSLSSPTVAPTTATTVSPHLQQDANSPALRQEEAKSTLTLLSPRLLATQGVPSASSLFAAATSKLFGTEAGSPVDAVAHETLSPSQEATRKVTLQESTTGSPTNVGSPIRSPQQEETTVEKDSVKQPQEEEDLPIEWRFSPTPSARSRAMSIIEELKEEMKPHHAHHRRRSSLSSRSGSRAGHSPQRNVSFSDMLQEEKHATETPPRGHSRRSSNASVQILTLSRPQSPLSPHLPSPHAYRSPPTATSPEPTPLPGLTSHLRSSTAQMIKTANASADDLYRGFLNAYQPMEEETLHRRRQSTAQSDQPLFALPPQEERRSPRLKSVNLDDKLSRLSTTFSKEMAQWSGQILASLSHTSKGADATHASLQHMLARLDDLTAIDHQRDTQSIKANREWIETMKEVLHTALSTMQQQDAQKWQGIESHLDETLAPLLQRVEAWRREQEEDNKLKREQWVQQREALSASLIQCFTEAQETLVDLKKSEQLSARTLFETMQRLARSCFALLEPKRAISFDPIDLSSLSTDPLVDSRVDLQSNDDLLPTIVDEPKGGSRQMKMLQARTAQLETALETLRKERNGYKKALEARRTFVQDQDEFRALRREKDVLGSEIANLQDQLRKRDARVKALESQTKQQTQLLAESATRVEKLATLESEVNAGHLQLETLQRKNIKLMRTVHELSEINRRFTQKYGSGAFTEDVPMVPPTEPKAEQVPSPAIRFPSDDSIYDQDTLVMSPSRTAIPIIGRKPQEDTVHWEEQANTMFEVRPLPRAESTRSRKRSQSSPRPVSRPISPPRRRPVSKKSVPFPLTRTGSWATLPSITRVLKSPVPPPQEERQPSPLPGPNAAISERLAYLLEGVQSQQTKQEVAAKSHQLSQAIHAKLRYHL